ncbi:MAG: TldD/PmbA family protein [Promethearchaeota archaeon]
MEYSDFPKHQDMIVRCVDFGRDRGADYLEIRYIHAFNEGTGTINGEILSAVKSESKGIGIRVLVGGGISFVSTARLKRGDIEDAIEKAIRLARATKRKNPIIFSEENVVETKWSVPVKIPFTDVDAEEKMNRLVELDKVLLSEVGKKALPNRNAFVSLETHKKFIATSEGTRIESDYSLGFIYLMLTAQDSTGDRSEQRGIGRGGTFGWSWFASPEFISTFVKEAKNVVKVVEKAKYRKFDEPLDVIIGPEVAGIIAHENAGHPSEMDRIRGREGAEAGESFWADIEIGKEQIGSPAVTIIDDPTIPGSAGYYEYDDEGVKSKPRYLIKDGIITEPLMNRQFAGAMGVQSNASARSVAFDREPLIRMANTYIQEGNYSLDELAEDIKFGVYIDSFNEWNIDDRRYQSKYVGSSAQLIENGEITEHYIRRPVLELTSRGLFSSIDACGKGFRGDFATCGKSNPSQGCPVWTAGPTEGVRMRNIRLGRMIDHE